MGTTESGTGISIERTWHRSNARVMGSLAEIVIQGPAALVPLAFARLRRLERAWSRFIPDSELNRLHACRGSWMECSNDLAEALRLSMRMHIETAGLFDPSIRASLEQLGYDRTFVEIVEQSIAPRPPIAVTRSHGLGGLEIIGNRARIAGELSIDLGGIGKGLAADIVADELIAAGARSAYLSLGGDIHAAGEPVDAQGWGVPLVHPQTGETIDRHALYSGAIVMSTTAIRRWRRDGVEHHHIIDPRTGAPAITDLVAVAVADASAARGEALAKAAIIAGRDAGAALLSAADVTAWLIGADDVNRLGGPHR